MKLSLAAAGIFLLSCGVLAIREDEQVVILSGDTQGYLSPCGCTTPMVGGIRRRAAAIRKLTAPGRTTLLENGGLVEGFGRQDQMKAETIVQGMAELGVSAINVSASDARLGSGMLLELSQLSGHKMVSLSVEHPEDHAFASMIRSGPFLVGGVCDTPGSLAGILGARAVSVDEAVKSLVEAADESNVKPVLMLQGGHDAAVRIARANPRLALIQYSSIGDPPGRLEVVGETAIATNGEHGKHIVRLLFREGRFSGYQSVALGPQVRDDPTIGRYYAAYLKRVREEKLLEALPRRRTQGYSGSWACMPCHQAAGHIWKLSSHRSALSTLEKDGHDADPDCVNCHVVGLESTRGFRSRSATPQLAGVGCENCHGPGLSHVRNPSGSKLSRVSARACAGCHNPLNSPNFDFTEYWRKIVHR